MSVLTAHVVWYENYERSRLVPCQRLRWADSPKLQNSWKITETKKGLVCLWTSGCFQPLPSCQKIQSQTLHSLWTLPLLRWKTPTNQVGGPTSYNSCRMLWSNRCGGTTMPGLFMNLLMQSLLDYQWVDYKYCKFAHKFAHNIPV